MSVLRLEGRTGGRAKPNTAVLLQRGRRLAKQLRHQRNQLFSEDQGHRALSGRWQGFSSLCGMGNYQDDRDPTDGGDRLLPEGDTPSVLNDARARSAGLPIVATDEYADPLGE